MQSVHVVNIIRLDRKQLSRSVPAIPFVAPYSLLAYMQFMGSFIVECLWHTTSKWPLPLLAHNIDFMLIFFIA